MRRAFSAVAVALALGCTTANWKAEYHAPETAQTALPQAEAAAAYVKVHTRDGQVYVLDTWTLDEAGGVIQGHGLHYSTHRVLMHEGQQTIAYADVELLETNTPERLVHTTSLVIMGAVTAAVPIVGVACLANPKACYGSCPTFYVYAEDGALELRAEGFSAAIVRALEQRDVDDLGVVDPAAGRFSLVMANEALETHFVRGLELLSVARPDASVEVVHTREGFLGVRDRRAPQQCTGVAGDCTQLLARADGQEYSSTTDGEDLATREIIELEFAAPKSLPREGAGSGRAADAKETELELALTIRARNTLLDTFLFYQALAYIGGEASRWFLDEPDGGAWSVLRSDFTSLLGNIDVEVWDGQRWIAAGSHRELGPIAHDRQGIVLPRLSGRANEPVRVRLSLVRGRWKLDEVSLGTHVGALTATRVQPSSLARDGQLDAAGLAALLDPDRYLMSYPGDVWTIGYELPAGSQALFLAAQGYYLEWMRDEWVAEQDLVEAARFFLTPAATLRKLAPIYKAMEGELEPVFWHTRIRPLPLEGARGGEP